MDIRIQIDAPELTEALNNLANSITSSQSTPSSIAAPEPEQSAAQEEPVEEEQVSETTTTVTLEEVRSKLAAISQSGKQSEVKELITSFGAKRLTDIPQERYPELLKAAEGL